MTLPGAVSNLMRATQGEERQARSGFRIDPLLERMAAPQLIRMAARFAPGQDARQIQKARDAVQGALDSPRSLKALVAGLSPLERFLLGEVKRHPQGTDGWALLASARAHGLKPAEKPASVELYRHFRPATFDGAELIWPLMADGLLIPATLPSPFMEGYGRGLEAGSAQLIADDRLLAALPEEEARPPLALRVPPAPHVPQATSPQLLMLRLLEVLRAVRREGGLPLTKGGEYNRNAFKRLQKRLPALPDAGFWVGVAQQGGLLEMQNDALRPAPDSARLLHSDPAELIRNLGRLYEHLDTGEEPSGQLLAHLGPLRASLIGLLGTLPPTTLAGLRDALETCTPEVLRLPSWRGQGNHWRGWLQEALRGPLRELGLVGLSGEGDAQVVAPAEALHGATTSPIPPGPAWVVQPNFELVVYPAQLGAQELELLSAAEATRFDDHSATYRLTRESVYGALEDGLSLSDLLSGLETHSATPLPPGVHGALTGWAQRRERLVLHSGATLLEFSSPEARDAYRKTSGGRAVGKLLLLPDAGQPLPAGLPTLNYDGPPRRTLSVSADGLIGVQGELDFPGRRLLQEHAEAVRGGYRLRPGQPLSPGAVGDLEARVQGSLPPLLKLQLARWSGQESAPALGQATLLQHPQAAALLTHPALAPLLQGLIAPGLLLVREGQQGALERELTTLGLTPDGEFSAQAGTSARSAAPPPDYEFPEDTRRKRLLLEQAIEGGRNVRLMYQTETFHGWYGESRPGRTRQRVLRPLGIDKEGSTPYLLAEGLDDPEEERIRIGYVLGIALL